jgi:hypothetical protein
MFKDSISTLISATNVLKSWKLIHTLYLHLSKSIHSQVLIPVRVFTKKESSVTLSLENYFIENYCTVAPVSKSEIPLETVDERRKRKTKKPVDNDDKQEEEENKPLVPVREHAFAHFNLSANFWKDIFDEVMPINTRKAFVVCSAVPAYGKVNVFAL